MKYRQDREFAEQMDALDPLASYRNKFYIPQTTSGQESIYFCGQSLGLQPVTVQDYIEQVLHGWRTLGFQGHFRGNSPWIFYSDSLKPKMARIVGARESEVVIMNTLTVNLHLMMVSFYQPTPHKYKILIESPVFPSDRYAVTSQIQFHGYDPAIALLEIQPREGETCIRTEDIESLLDKEGASIALVLLGAVNYLTGQFFEIQKIVDRAHFHDCIVGLDLAHAAGNVPLALHDWNVDFAVWCNYKYINAGPGAIAGCFVHEKYAESFDLPRLTGWWGGDVKTRFLMGSDFQPTPAASGWQMSNPDILSLAALAASLDIFETVGMERLRAKSQQLNSYLEFLLDRASDERISHITPRDPEQRGCQLSLSIKDSDTTVLEKLNECGVFCDWREPNVIRVAPMPLFNRYTEVFDFVEILKDILSSSTGLTQLA
ncbi:kynureninase [Scytonema sp. UIC 10036]|uniref:kynureninase n=1 Tax=Scytonema sp. UIC 10036 TaxID=2304196 RepID=UPI001FAA57E5|nr:kynureninase [Scytonema sp. UIC 10036]